MGERFEPNLPSLRRHRVPAWFENAKLGIFIHWGLSSIPAWAPNVGSHPELVRNHFHEMAVLSPYAEWYWNALRVPESPTARHHAETYGPDASYEDFRPAFERMLERWDPQPWVELFAAAGARYVVLVTKHHDGFVLWRTATENPRKPGWHTARDVVGDFANAIRARGMRFGVYYSGGLDWTFTERPIRNVAEMMASIPLGPQYAAYVDAHYRELVERYRPSVLWNDIAYPPGRGIWKLLADYYTAVPEGVVNDRFLPANAPATRLLQLAPVRAAANALARWVTRRPGFVLAPPRPPHWDFRTPEYATFPNLRPEKWEATRGIGHSFGYNRNDPENHYIEPTKLVRSFVDTVSKNGNLLLNVGPTGQGEIPEAQASRLRALGAWLREHGEAVYDTRPWRRAEGATREGPVLRFTSASDALYAIVMGRPQTPSLTPIDVVDRAPAKVELLGHGPVTWRVEGRDVQVSWPPGLPDRPAYVLKLEWEYRDREPV